MRFHPMHPMPMSSFVVVFFVVFLFVVVFWGGVTLSVALRTFSFFFESGEALGLLLMLTI